MRSGVTAIAVILASFGGSSLTATAQEATEERGSSEPSTSLPESPDASTQDDSADSGAYVLPEVVVEAAPAKRNEKKQAMRAAPVATPAPAGSGESQGTTPLPGVVVEGEKVLRTIYDTTTSVSIVTGQEITDRQLFDLKEVLSQQPNVVTSDDSTGFAIRGLNSEGLTGLQHISGVPLISVTIDGATQNPDAVRRGARGLWDIDQVEVLRGPQSTLQGRNSLGGAVVIKTNDPTYKREIIVEGTAGTSELTTGGFVLNSPIAAGQSAFRISGYSYNHERDIDYAIPANAEMGEDEYWNLRGKLLIEPDTMPALSALFTISHTVDKPGSSIVSALSDDPIAPESDFFERQFVRSAAFTDFRDATSDNYVADIAYEINPDLTLRSVSAFADTETLIKTAAGAAFSRNGDSTTGKDFTQDLRLELANEGNGLSGVAGLFYGYFERASYNDQTIYLPYFFGEGLPIDTAPYRDATLSAETNSLAAYADLRYRLNRWSFIGGGRLLHDEVTTHGAGTALNLDNLFASFFDPTVNPYDSAAEDSEASFNEFLPKLGITYDLTDNQTIGVSYSKGYRTGFEQLTPDNRYVTVDPEYLDDYEFSYRSTWLDNTLDFNSNVFFYDYTDQQVTVLNQYYGVAEILNAGKSQAYGAELEARWRPVEPLQLFAALGLLETEFEEMTTSQGDFAGNQFPDAPPVTFSAGGMYRSEMGWFAGGNLRYTGGYFSTGDLSNSPLREVDSYVVVDARVGWEWERFTLTAFAKNLFDEQYLTQVDRTNAPPLAPAYAFVGEERIVGVTLNGHF
ncbi:TonB-dependent receptor [Methyloligella solikamskensis]|uniref:TonB-dependent receptor n=1 Tax=Methyloligella solikamskensis TaxID=1177756 RepID=A0ABW3J5Z1_9HYPH